MKQPSSDKKRGQSLGVSPGLLTAWAHAPTMIDGARWLGLEVKYLDRAVSFYEAFLDLAVTERTERSVVLEAGTTDLVLRAPGPHPRGGLHTHYALGIPAASYDWWYDRLAERFDLVEKEFGGARSLYFYDTAGNCVELGEGRLEAATGADADETAITACFEVVLEVESLGAAMDFYGDLGFELLGEGDERRRARLNAGTLDLELWEPQLGIADARGGVHVDLGLGVEDAAEVAERVADRVRKRETIDDGVRLRDPDDHVLTLVE
jgi:catechol 2,3-dioxygenase-like lactoylglutathione lyase family enzyme